MTEYTMFCVLIIYMIYIRVGLIETINLLNK